MEYRQIVFKAEEGITFDVSNEPNGELIIKARSSEKASNYANPPIPKGYKHICGEWNNGLVIERDDGSQFVWIPVGMLDCNGTLDGTHFVESFGRRKYLNDKFSDSAFHETVTSEFALQIGSVKKYGGFYISRYNISKDKKTGKPQSIKGAIPWVDINFYDAKKVASTIENNQAVKSHLPFGAEFDSVLEWFVKSGSRTHFDIINDSTDWGNYWNTKNSPRKLEKTGTHEEWATNNIFDLAGNVNEWTQEEKASSNRVIRGGKYNYNGFLCSVGCRDYAYPDSHCNGTGFRVALYLE